MVRPRIHIPQEELAALCHRHHIRRLALFGSVLRDDFGPESDVDVLVEFDRRYPGGFRIFRVEGELSRLFGGRKVDLVNPRYINARLRDRVLNNLLVQYEAGSPAYSSIATRHPS
ncbi:MAG: nucleotidyltransferase family protein [Phycisphaerales bacterium]|nr:nucleotidyltransferase family protein [Phycisphaerales bacterium]